MLEMRGDGDEEGSPLQGPMSSFTKTKVTDTELKAMYLFFKQLDPKPTPHA